MSQDRSNAAPGWALRRLYAIHAELRTDLKHLNRAVEAITQDGADVEAAMAEIQKLSFIGPEWTFRTFCEAVCGTVHEHHQTEDGMLFPGLLQLPGHDRDDLKALIKQLEAEHRTLSDYVGDVERALRALPGDEAAKSAAVEAMRRLSEHLTAHLDFEEEQLAPALNRFSELVPEKEVPSPPLPEHWQSRNVVID